LAKQCGQFEEELLKVATMDLSGSAAGLEVQLVGFPYRTCPHEHEKIYVYPDFGSELAEFLFGRLFRL
jgi:hypothetical protein